MKRTWHKARNRQRDAAYQSLTASARGVLRDLEEILDEDPQLTGNVTHFARWTGLDRKTVREGIEAIARLGLLRVEKEDQGKAGVFYTISDPERVPAKPKATPEHPQGMAQAGTEDPSTNTQGSPKQTPTMYQADPNHAPTIPQVSPNHGPHKSSLNADHSDFALIEIGEREGEREENRGEGDARTRELAPAAAHFPDFPSELEEFEAWWAAKKGRNPPLGPGEIADMRTAIALPGMSILRIKAYVDRILADKAAKGKRIPGSFSYFLQGLRDEAQRQELLAAPVQMTPGTSPGGSVPGVPRKPRITSLGHYQAIVEDGLDPNDFENPDEFKPREEVAV